MKKRDREKLVVASIIGGLFLFALIYYYGSTEQTQIKFSKTCLPSTTTPYCAKFIKDRYFVCKDGITKREFCKLGLVCRSGIGCGLPLP